MPHRSNADFRRILSELDLSQADLSRIAEVDVTTVSRWAMGKRRIPGILWAYLDLKLELKRLNEPARKDTKR